MRSNIILIVVIFILAFLVKFNTPNEEINETINEVDPYLILVNKDNPLDKNYVPDNLVELKSASFRQIEVMPELVDNYINLIEIIPYDFHLFSGYRSYERQEEIFSDSLESNYVAKPGFSEHQTGLAIDISLEHIGLTELLANEPAYIHLMHNAHKFGFIVRYPKGKEDITGYSFEPWHLRYVGVAHSTYIYDNNLTLEEYLDSHYKQKK